MELIQAQDNLAFNEMYSRYRGPLYSYFSGLVNSSLGEELMQETFVKVLNKKETFRFESKFKTWIWTIAKNTLRDHWRTLDHRMKNSFDELINDSGEEVFHSIEDSQESALLKKVTQHQLKTCINELPEDQKEIVFLHIQSELSNQEIADLTNVSLGAVKSVLFRSKEKLIDCFKRGGHL